MNIETIEAMVARHTIEEWVNEYREPTKDEIAQRKKDIAENAEREKENKAERKRRKDNARQKLEKAGLTLDDMKDIVAEVLNGGE